MRDSDDAVSVRNLGGIQETEPGARPPRLAALIMASFGGACIVFVALVLMRGGTNAPIKPVDPLGDLVARTHPAGVSRQPVRLGVADVSFPGVLTDRGQPTTAMALVRDASPGARGREARPDATGPAPDATAQAPESAAGDEAAERLPVVPLPAQGMLWRPETKVASGDRLHQMARRLSREQGEETAEPGGPGGYQLQVASFRVEPQAQAFAEALRRRGHRAYVASAQVAGRGEWHRVRVGPFKYLRSVQIYRQEFEAKERLVTLLVDPPRARVRIGLADEKE